ncbi:MAG: peptide deformylase [Oscillospiraceae bacterium]|nr:peptide deformylase [Oscillospiraceae bacterium]
MALRKLTNWNDPIFRKKSREVAPDKFDERLHILLDDMLETLIRANGYGCAAVHVGILRRVVIILANDNHELIELINPQIIEKSDELIEIQEGSIAPDSPQAIVMRPKSVTVTGFDRYGKSITVKGEGFLAATLCHEIDHLDGILFI